MSDYATKLKESPTFAMSLGSKELFHSNFIGWLIEKDSSFINIFYDGFSKITEVCREWQHFDLTIWDGKDYIIIENKMKSIPYKDQLVKYNEKIEEKSKKKRYTCKKKILLSFSEPFEGYKETGWEWMNYNYLIEKLEEYINKSDYFSNHPDSKTTALDYCKSTIMLNKFINELADNHKNVLDYQKKNNDLRYLNIHDMYEKIVASNLKNYIQDKLYKKIEAKYHGLELKIHQDFTHGQAMLNIHYEGELNKHYYKVGLQIQEYHYARGVHVDGCFNADETFKYFSKPEVNYFSKEITGKRRKPYRSYKTDNYKYIYKIQDQHNVVGMKFEDLLSLIIEDLKFAQKVIDQHLDYFANNPKEFQ